MELEAEEFIRRFLLQVVPDGFVRIRHFGLLANRTRNAKLARCRQLLAQPAPATRPIESVPADAGGGWKRLTANLHGHEAGNGGYSQGEPTELYARARLY